RKSSRSRCAVFSFRSSRAACPRQRLACNTGTTVTGFCYGGNRSVARVGNPGRLAGVAAKGCNVTISVNGEPMDFPPGMTIAELLGLLKVVPAQVAVELDRAIVPRASWAKPQISARAALEIVRFVGGG